MNVYIRSFAFGIGAVLFISILTLMIKRKSNESMSLIWVGVALSSIILAAFPQLIDYLSAIFRIDYPPILIAIIAIVFLITIVFYLSNELAEAQNKINELSIQVSLLNKDVADIKETLDSNSFTVRL